MARRGRLCVRDHSIAACKDEGFAENEVNLVEFHPEHIEAMDLADFDRMALDGHKIGRPGVAFTLMDGERVLGCAGLIPVDDHTEAWAVMSDELRGRPMVLHRLVRRALRIHDSTWPVQIRAVARCEAAFACKWLERLGFKAVGEDDGFVQYQRG